MLIPLKLKNRNSLIFCLLTNAAICESKLTPKHRFYISRYSVYRTDCNQFGGGVMLLVYSTIRHDQLSLPGIVNLETIAVCLYMHHNTRLLFVSTYNPPDSIILHSDLDNVFSSYDSVFLISYLKVNIRLGILILLTETAMRFYRTLYHGT
jgi:hypothetical protein